MTDWAVLGRDGDRARIFVLRGPHVLNEGTAPDPATALAQIDPIPRNIFRIGEGYSEPLPTQLVPHADHGLAGLTQETPPDVIDGWVRLLLIGLSHVRTNWDGVAWVVRGELSHWIHLSAGEAVSCQSFLTPQLITMLGGAFPPCETAISDTISRPERLAAHLRAAQVAGNAAALSGSLLGAEMAAARPYWLGQSVSLIAPEPRASGYVAALTTLGVTPSVFDPDMLIAPALSALWGSLANGATPTDN